MTQLSSLSRRDLGKAALAALPLSLFAKPNSRFGGVQVGINAPYSFRGMPADADSVLKAMLDAGLSAAELRSQPVEQFFGAPVVTRLPGRNPNSPEKEAEAKASFAALEKWRLAASMDKFKEFRKKWNEAGVDIEILKFDAVDHMSDDGVAYAFALARALGARAISCEIPVSKTKWLGELAAHHKMRVAYHGHGDVKNPEAFATPESWERSMSYSKYNCINLDLGHFLAGNNTSPIPFMKKHADRITHIHLKDRKLNNGPNRPWGEGDTPIIEALQTIRKEKYPFQATIEFEYQVPEGSTVMKEIIKCVEYCRKALA